MRKSDVNLLNRTITSLALTVMFIVVTTPGATFAAPPNDNFANAQVITGVSGSVIGTNFGATAEGGEPVHVAGGFSDNSSVWYSWTAPAAGNVKFDIGASTINGQASELDTVMAVYTGTSFSDLKVVGNNDDKSTNTYMSAVSFAAKQNTVYYIAVDSWLPSSGSFLLDWSLTEDTNSTSILQQTNGSAGTVFVSATRASSIFPALYVFGDKEGEAITGPVYGTFPYSYDYPHVTISRKGGAKGRILVDYNVTNMVYTNLFYTNVQVPPDSIDTNTGTSNAVVWYRHIYQYNNLGTLDTLEYYGMTTITNVGTNSLFGADLSRYVFVEFPTDAQLPTTDWMTNWPLTNFITNSLVVNITNIYSFTNITPVLTNITYVTNIALTTNLVTVTNISNGCVQYTGSATAYEDYFPQSGTVVLDDYMMSTNLEIDSIFSTMSFNSGNSESGAVSAVNKTIIVALSNPRFDPLESLDTTTTNVVSDINAPVLDTNNYFGAITILNSSYAAGYNPSRAATNETDGAYPVINFQKVNYRVENGFGVISVFLERTASSKSCQVGWDIDYNPATSAFDNNTFATEPGSDYALRDVDFMMTNGTINFPDGAIYDIQRIGIPIYTNSLVQFNRDLRVRVYKLNPEDQVNIGNIGTCTVTILFDAHLNGPQTAGSVDRTFNPESRSGLWSYGYEMSYPPANNNPGANKTVYAVASQSDGTTVIGGSFTALNGLPRNRIARMTTAGWPDTSFDPGSGANDSVVAIGIDGSQRAVIGGLFTSINGKNRYHIARLNIDGSLDSSFNPGSGADGTVWALSIQNDGKIVIAGEFTSYNGTNRNHVARLNSDGSLDPDFNPGVGPNGNVLAVGVESSGNVLIGGEFTSVSGKSMRSIARLTSSGAVDTTFDIGSGGIDGPVYSLVEQLDGKVIIGGSFSTLNYLSRNNIARLSKTGAVDTTFDPGTGTDGAVYSLALQTDGKIFVGGLFTTFNQTRRVGITRLFTTGAVDTSFMDTGYNQFAGLPNHYANQLAYNENDNPAAANYRNAVLSIGILPSGNVIIGGKFARVGGGFTRDDVRVQANVARLIGGITPGPGNIEFMSSGYSVDENAGQLFVSLIRTNGHLGPVNVTFDTNTYAAGVGALGAGEFSLGNRYRFPVWTNYWSSFLQLSGEHVDYGWQKADGVWGPNFNMIPGKSSYGYTYLTIQDNKIVDGNRTAPLSLLTPAGGLTLGQVPISTSPALGRASAVMTVVDNDNLPGEFAFASTNYSVNENDGSITLTVLRTNGSAGTVTIDYGVFNGTATNKVDYRMPAGYRLSFADGVTNQSITVPIIDNTAVQPDRTFSVFLATPTGGATLNSSASNAVVTIIDNDFLAGHLSFAVSNYTVSEISTSAVVAVTRRGGGAGTLSVQYSVTDGTAVNNINYLGSTNTLWWDSGDTTSRIIYVPIVHDGAATSDLTVNLKLFNPIISNDPNNSYNSVVLASQITNSILTILNQDFNGYLAFGSANFNVMENAGTATFTVNRKYGVSGAISVGYKTVDGTAISGTNYIGVTNRLNFAAGESSKTFSVTLLDDIATNSDRSFSLQLFNGSPTNVLALDGLQVTSTVTIIDNETTHENAGSVDPTYLVGEGFNDFIFALAKQKDGKIVAGGNFTYANKAIRNRIARMNADGTIDMAFQMTQAGADDTVRAIVCQTPKPSTGDTNGPIVIGGSFTSVNGVNRSGLARLYQNGALDETFDPGSGTDNAIYAMTEVLKAGTNVFQRKVLIAGSFGYYNGIVANGVARINDDGTMDRTFDVGSGVGGTNGTVYAVAVQANDQVLIGGDFVQFNGYSRHHLARLLENGAVDTTFNPTVEGSVRSIVVQDDGKILIAGALTNVNGVAYNHVARLNADGTLDTHFKPALGANDTVLTLAVDSQGKILLGGEFTRASGVTRSRITQLNNDGSVDPGINFGYAADSFVSSIILQDDGKIVVGGGFNTFNGLSYPSLVRLFGGTMFNSGTLEFDAPSYIVDENGTNAVVLVRRLGGTYDTANGSLSASVITLDGSAKGGSSFAALTNIVNFPVGETFQTVKIPVIDNYVLDGNRYFYVVLTNYSVSSAIGPQPQATVTIVDDECGVSFSDIQHRVMENVASGMARILVTRVGNTNTAFTVDVMSLTNGTAVDGVRYSAQTNTLIFAVGETNHYFYLPILNDNVVIGDQTVTMLLTNIVGPYSALITEPRMATLSIIEDDTAAGNLSFTSTNYYCMENSGFAVVTVTRTNGITGLISVDYSTTNGTALPGNRYLGTNGTLVFADGETSKQIRVPLINDGISQGDQYFIVKLTNPTGGAAIINSTTTYVTVVDDDAGIGFSQQAYNVDELAGVISLTVQRVGNSNGIATVNYSTVNGTAKAGVNFTGTTNQLKFADGETLKTFSVPLIHDNLVTGNKSFSVVLSNPVSAIGTTVQLSENYSALVVMVDADNSFSFGTNSYTVAESGTNVLITVIRSGSSLRSNVVYFATSDGTAGAGTKYIATNGALVFQSGDVTKSFVVPIINNTTVEGDTYFNVGLSSPTGGSQLAYPSNVIVNILDDDIGLSFSSPTYSVSECGVKATITVIRDGLTNSHVSVGYVTADGTAVDGKNYNASSGVLDFEAGQRTNTFTVQVIDDNRILGDSTVLLSLVNATGGATVHYPLTSTLTISECDGTLIVPAGSALVAESYLPTNNVVDTNESVTMWFGLRSVSGSTTNLQATLLATNGVTNIIKATQYYGALNQNGHSISMPFSFTAAGTNGQRIQATFVLQDGTRTNFEPVLFSFDIGQHLTTASNSSPIVINDNAAASPYPSTIALTGVSGVINGASVTISNFNHTYPSDVNVMLVGPNGGKAFMLSHCGGGSPVQQAWMTFSDTATSALSVSGKIASGVYKPSLNVSTNLYDYIFTGAPAGPMSTNFSVFNGIEPNGKWSLYVMDDKAMDSGIISNGWSIAFATGSAIRSSSDLEVNVTPSTSSTVVGNTLTYTVTVTNYGPGEATNVIVSGVLPKNVTYVSGPVNGTNVVDGNWNYTIGKLAMPKLVGAALQYSGISFTVTVVPQTSAVATNVIAVASAMDDPNTENNTVTTLTAVGITSADLSVSLSESPNPAPFGGTLTYTIQVVNNGPARAVGVILTNDLPEGGVLVTQLGTNWTKSGTTLIGNLGDMEINGQTTITLQVWAGLAGTVTDSVRVGSVVLDTLKANNIASVKTEVGNPPSMTVIKSANGLQITWPVGGSYVLETATSMSDNVVWTEVTSPTPTVVSGQNVITITYGQGNQFFRLKLKQ